MEENWAATCERMELDQCLTPHKKIKWIKDLDIRPQTKAINSNISISNFFLDVPLQAKETKAKIN